MYSPLFDCYVLRFVKNMKGSLHCRARCACFLNALREDVSLLSAVICFYRIYKTHVVGNSVTYSSALRVVINYCI